MPRNPWLEDTIPSGLPGSVSKSLWALVHSFINAKLANWDCGGKRSATPLLGSGLTTEAY